jgi:hypothetical protein
MLLPAAVCALPEHERLAAWQAPRALPDYSRSLLNGWRGRQHGAKRRCRAAADHVFAVEEQADSDPGLQPRLLPSLPWSTSRALVLSPGNRRKSTYD